MPVAHDLKVDQPVFILQHALGDYLGVAVDRVEAVGAKRARYKTNTNPGSSGSPCFNDDWELVALHHSGENRPQPTWNEGIPFSAILARSEVRDALDQTIG